MESRKIAQLMAGMFIALFGLVVGDALAPTPTLAGTCTFTHCSGTSCGPTINPFDCEQTGALTCTTSECDLGGDCGHDMYCQE